jgi:Skp family chaperone for outer membrane proteins
MGAQSDMNVTINDPPARAMPTTVSPDMSAQLKEIVDLFKKNGDEIHALRNEVRALGEKLRPLLHDAPSTTVSAPATVSANAMEEMRQKHEAEIKALRDELKALRGEVQSRFAEGQSLQESESKALPEVSRHFSGYGSQFNSWAREIANCLINHGDSFRSKKEQWVWIWNQLGSHVQSELAAYFAKGGLNGDYNAGELIDYIHKQYYDCF